MKILKAMYAAIEYQEVFGKAGIFSPSFWFSDEIYTHVETTGKVDEMRFYFIGGSNEGSNMALKIMEMENLLYQVGFAESEVSTIIHPDGTHSEGYWSREFPAAYEWLYSNNNPLSLGDEEEEVIEQEEGTNKEDYFVFPNPSSGFVEILSKKNLEEAHLKIYNTEGLLMEEVGGAQFSRIGLQDFQAGLYYFLIENKGEVMVRKVVMK